MDNLDFSSLTDDQLLGLVHAALRECVRRNPAVNAAAQAAVLDEGEKARIAAQSAEREAAVLRAKERERVAREAAERVRREQEEQRAKIDQEAVAQAGREAMERAEKKAAEERGWLDRVATALGMSPANICILQIPAYADSGTRVVVNEGHDKYDRDHLVDWASKTNTIKTVRRLVGQKTALVGLLAEFHAWAKARSPREYVGLFGNSYHWEESNGRTG